MCAVITETETTVPETTAIETAVPEATTEQVTILLGAVLKKTVIFFKHIHESQQASKYCSYNIATMNSVYDFRFILVTVRIAIAFNIKINLHTILPFIEIRCICS